MPEAKAAFERDHTTPRAFPVENRTMFLQALRSRGSVKLQATQTKTRCASGISSRLLTVPQHEQRRVGLSSECW